MIADAKHNEPVSDMTSMRYEKISAAKPDSPRVATDLSEEAMLRHHAESAMSAMRDLLGKIQGDMAHAADPREWAERYPWATVAVAAAAGFAAAATIAGRKTQSAPAAPPVATPSGVVPESVSASERERYEAYLRDSARAETATPPPPPRESIWTPLIEMAKAAASSYLMSAAQAGIAAFAAAHAANAATEEAVDKNGDDASNDSNPDVVPT